MLDIQLKTVSWLRVGADGKTGREIGKGGKRESDCNLERFLLALTGALESQITVNLIVHPAQVYLELSFFNYLTHKSSRAYWSTLEHTWYCSSYSFIENLSFLVLICTSVCLSEEPSISCIKCLCIFHRRQNLVDVGKFESFTGFLFIFISLLINNMK